jgi:hypothetical protein
MLEVQSSIRIRKDNTYVPITRYKLTSLRLDLYSSIITIKVEFYRDETFLFHRIYDMGKVADTDVNVLIKEVHKIINAEG